MNTLASSTRCRWAQVCLAAASLLPQIPERLAKADSVEIASGELSIELQAGQRIRLGWPQVFGNAGVEFSSTLGMNKDWQQVPSAATLSDGRYSLLLTRSESSMFYRLRLEAPVLDVRLANDTGLSAQDGITSEVSLAGTLYNRASVASLRAGFDQANPASYVNVLTEVGSDGSFFFGHDRLMEIAGGGLADGHHTLHLVATAVNGADCTLDLAFFLDTTGPAARLSPAPGDSSVLPNQTVEAAFNEPVWIGRMDVAGNFQPVTAASVITLSLWGEPVPSRAFHDATGARLGVVPAASLAPASTYSVTVDSARIMDAAGNAASIVPSRFTFRTAGGLGIPGTGVAGRVFDSAPGPGGVDVPLAGARISLVSDPSHATTTDSQGFFRLDSVPGGKLMVEVDGGTVATAAGTFYPTVTELIDIIPGRLNTFGSAIFLPLAREADFAVINNTPGATTAVTNPTQLAGWNLSVPAGAVQRRDGGVASRILLAPVDPDRLPAPLPAGFNPAIVITIQSEGGADVFTEPVPLTAPNLEGLPPGSKTVLWDFDHARGDFIPAATMTVSADGLTVSTDPGQGVVRPGWHLVLRLVLARVKAADTVDHKNDGRPLTPEQRAELAKLLNDAIRSLEKTAAGAISTVPIPGPAGIITNYGLNGLGNAIGGMGDSAGPSGNPQDAVEQVGNVAGATGLTAVNAVALSSAASAAAAQGRAMGAQQLRDALQGKPDAVQGVADANRARNNAVKLMNELGKLKKAADALNTISSAISTLAEWKKLVDLTKAINDLLEDPPGDAVSIFLAAVDEAMQDSLQGFVDGMEMNFRASEAAVLAAEMVSLTSDWPSSSAALTPTVRAGMTRIAGEYAANEQLLANAEQRTRQSLPTALDALDRLKSTLAPDPEGQVFYKVEMADGTVVRGTAPGGEFFPVRFGIAEGAQVARVIAATADGSAIGSAVVAVPSAPPAGGTFDGPIIFLSQSTAPDANANGIADDIEDVISAAPITRAQASDLLAGVSPVAAGLDVSGLVSRLPLAGGSVVDLAGAGTTVFAAELGRIIVADYSDPMRPSILSRIATPSPVVRLSASQGEGLLAATLADGAVKVYDVADPLAAREILNIPRNTATTSPALLADGWLVLQTTTGLEVRNPLEGGLEASLALPGAGAVQDMYFTGGVVYVLRGDSTLTLTAVSMSVAGALTLLDSADLPCRVLEVMTPRLSGGGGRLVVTGAAAPGSSVPGFTRIDVSNPGNLLPGTAGSQGSAAAANDGGGNLIAVRPGAVPPDLAIYARGNDSNPASRVLLATSGDELVLLNGYAIISAAAGLNGAGTGCLDAVRLPGTDTGGLGPSLAISSPAAGVEFVEGQPIAVRIEAQDDVRMARVELLLQGNNRVAVDTSYPFDLVFIAPPGLPNTPMSLSARAIDTAGNIRTVSVNGTYRALPPRLIATTPAPGSALPGPLATLHLAFDEMLNRDPMPDRAGITVRSAGADKLLGTADDVGFPVLGLGYDLNGSGLSIALGQALTPGNFRLSVGDGVIIDRGGVALDGEFSGAFPTGNGVPGGAFAMDFVVTPPPPINVDTFPFQLLGGWSLGPDGANFNLGRSRHIVADFNGDGRSDLALTRYDARSGQSELNLVEVSLQFANGTLSSALPHTVGPDPVQIAAGDVDGDGDTDLVTLNWEQDENFQNRQRTPYSLSVVLGNGDGSFQGERRIETGRTMAEPGVLRVADFTGDGRADVGLLVPDYHQGGFDDLDPDPAEVLIFRSLGGGAFAPPLVTIVPFGRAFSGERTHFVVGDFNGDASLDALVNGFAPVAGPEANQGRVLLGRGDGTFDSLVSPAFGQRGREWRLLTADLDNDGLDDVIFGNKVYRCLGNGAFVEIPDAGLSSLETFAFGPQVAGDFDTDGRTDLMARSSSGQERGIVQLRGNGNGTFTVIGRLFPLGPYDPGQLTLIDLNNDGRDDLLLPAPGGPGFIALFNSATGFVDPAVAVDADGSGLSLRDTAPSEGNGRTTADFNGDGRDDLIAPVGFAQIGLKVSAPGHGFGPRRQFPLPPGFNLGAQWPGDVDGNATVDLLIGDSGVNGRIFFFPGDGAGGLGAATEITGGGGLLGFTDLTGDGRPDIIARGTGAPPGVYLGVRVNQGGGAFGPMVNSRVTPTTSGMLVAAFPAAFGGDALPDLAVTIGAGGSVMINRGSGSFELADSTTGGSRLAAAGDFTGDGVADLLTRTGGFTDSRLQIWPGEAGGTLGDALPSQPTDLAGSDPIHVGDFNSDGILDLLGRNFQADPEARLSFGDGSGSFGPPVRFDAPLSGFDGGDAVLAGDFTGDGLLDIFIGATVLPQKAR